MARTFTARDELFRTVDVNNSPLPEEQLHDQIENIANSERYRQNELLNPLSGAVMIRNNLGEITPGQEIAYLSDFLRSRYIVLNLESIHLNNPQQVRLFINSVRVGLGLEPLTLNTIQENIDYISGGAATELTNLFRDLHG
jgi:hypothetical protein